MSSYIKLSVVTVLPAIMTAILYLLDNKTSFGKLNKWIKQTVFGIVFGVIAIIGTEYGIPMNGAQVNCRDGAVLTAGLIFGAPAGIIAGLIGGIERIIAVKWGIGTFTMVACSVSTIAAGIYSALLRKFMFEDKKPGWLISFAIGVVMEVFHLTMVFITNMATPEKAMEVVKACTVPMVLANGIAVTVASVTVSLLSKEKLIRKQSNVHISQTVQRWLLIAVTIAFLSTSFFVFSFQDAIADKQTDSLLELSLDEVKADIKDLVSIGENIDEKIKGMAKNRHIGNTGYLVIVDGDLEVISAPSELTPEKLKSDFEKITISESDSTFRMELDSEMTYCRYSDSNGYHIIAALPEEEAFQMRNVALYVNTFMEIMVFAILFGLIYMLIKKVVVNQIKSINRSLAKISGGDLDTVVNVRTSEEFASLSDDINTTVDTLKTYIAEASARIDKELEFAKNIQRSALPGVFPAFPKRKDFDIYASMDPAKEVGGDFYDFYITNNDTLNFLVADVSGKGIPAAMFMMRSKTELKSLTESDIPLSDVFTKSNASLCEGNDAGMFVTAWQGKLDLESGTLSYACAGHNPPLIRRNNGKFEYLKGRSGFVLAGMEGLKYKTEEIKLEKGDTIFLYTDGVTEATNKNNELFGEERLVNAANSRDFEDMKSLCAFIKSEVDGFVGEAPQFDDITMVALKYIGAPEIPTIRFENASISDIPAATDFVDSELEKADCPMKTVIQMNIALDEIFSNIVKYGYPEEKGPVTLKVEIKDDPRAVYLRFSDEGIPYNPLTKADPDVTLSASERQIGGLGIFMVKKTMDDVRYKYENDENILTIKKFF